MSERDLSEITLQAIEVLRVMEERMGKYSELNSKIAELMGDFPTHLQEQDGEINSAVMRLLNAILGDDGIASYYLYECSTVSPGTLKDGGSIRYEALGKEWRLRTIDDLATYLRERPAQ